MKNYFAHVRLLVWRLAVVLLVFSLSRGFFLALNLEYFHDLSIVEAVKLFIFGVQFDVAAVVYLNVLFILLHLIPGGFKEHRLYQRLLLGLFLAVNAFLLLFNYIDAQYFSFTNKRSTADLFRPVAGRYPRQVAEA